MTTQPKTAETPEVPAYTDPLDRDQRARYYALQSARYLLGDETSGLAGATKRFPTARSVWDLVNLADFIVRGTTLDDRADLDAEDDPGDSCFDDPSCMGDPRRPLTDAEMKRAQVDFGRFVERMTSAGLRIGSYAPVTDETAGDGPDAQVAAAEAEEVRK